MDQLPIQFKIFPNTIESSYLLQVCFSANTTLKEHNNKLSSPTLTWIYLEEVVLILDTLVTGMKPGMDTEMREDTSVTIHQGLHQALFIIVESDYFIRDRSI